MVKLASPRITATVAQNASPQNKSNIINKQRLTARETNPAPHETSSQSTTPWRATAEFRDALGSLHGMEQKPTHYNHTLKFRPHGLRLGAAEEQSCARARVKSHAVESTVTSVWQRNAQEPGRAGPLSLKDPHRLMALPEAPRQSKRRPAAPQRRPAL